MVLDKEERGGGILSARHLNIRKKGEPEGERERQREAAGREERSFSAEQVF